MAVIMRINASEMGEQDNSVLGWVMVVLDVLFMVASAVSAVLMVVLLRQSVRKDRMENATSIHPATVATPKAMVPRRKSTLTMAGVKKAVDTLKVDAFMETSDKARAAAVKHLETRQKLAKDRIKKRLANRRSAKHVSKEKEVCSVQTLSSALETPETGGAGIRPNKAAVAATTTGASNSTGTTTAAAAAAAVQR